MRFNGSGSKRLVWFPSVTKNAEMSASLLYPVQLCQLAERNTASTVMLRRHLKYHVCVKMCSVPSFLAGSPLDWSIQMSPNPRQGCSCLAPRVACSTGWGRWCWVGTCAQVYRKHSDTASGALDLHCWCQLRRAEQPGLISQLMSLLLLTWSLWLKGRVKSKDQVKSTARVRLCWEVFLELCARDIENSAKNIVKQVSEVPAASCCEINGLELDIYLSCSLLLSFIMPTSATNQKHQVVWNCSCLCRPVVHKQESLYIKHAEHSSSGPGLHGSCRGTPGGDWHRNLPGTVGS